MGAADFTFRRVGDEFLFAWPEYGFAIGFDGLRQERYGLCGSIYVKTNTPLQSTGRPGHVFQGLYNLEKLDDRDKLAKALYAKNDQAPWADLLEAARVETIEAFRRGEPTYRLAEVEPAPMAYLLEGILPLGDTSTGHADGAGGKSFLAAGMAVSVATGMEVGPFRPERVRPVLVLDWETTRDVWARRLRRICAALGIDVPKDIHYRQCSRTLASDITAVRAEVAKTKAGLVIVDSIAFACGGEVTADNAIPFFNALRSLGPDVTRWVISHVSKAVSMLERGTGDAYGTIFVKNSSRSYWAIKRDTNASPSEFEVSMTQTKVNDGPPQRAIGVKLRFEDPAGPIHLDRCDPLENAILSEHASLADRLRVLLRQGAQHVNYLAETTGAKPAVVRATLHKMADATSLSESHGRTPNTWGLIAPHREDAS